MNHDEFAAITKEFKTTEEGGFDVLPDGAQLTLYVAHQGASLGITRIDAYRAKGELLALRTAKKETFYVRLADVYAVSADGAAGGQPVRNPVGFRS